MSVSSGTYEPVLSLLSIFLARNTFRVLQSLNKVELPLDLALVTLRLDTEEAARQTAAEREHVDLFALEIRGLGRRQQQRQTVMD